MRVFYILILIIFYLSYTSCVSLVQYGDDELGSSMITSINQTTPITIDKKIKFHINTTQIEHAGYVEVSWRGVTPTKNNSDFVGVFTPGDLKSLETQAASKFIHVSKMVGFKQFGRGSHVFQLTSSRESFRFAFLQGDLLYPEIVAYSQEISLLNPNEPLHGQIGLSGVNSEVIINWNTRDISGFEQVQYGDNPQNLNHISYVYQSLTYQPQDLCGPVANVSGFMNPGYTHSAKLRNLKPNTRYYYKYGSPQKGFGFHSIENFLSFDEVGTDETVYFFATADVGNYASDNSTMILYEKATVKILDYMMQDIAKNDKYNLYHVHGDIGYANGVLAIWDNYFAQWEKFLTKMPLVITEGNHERDWRGSGDRFNNALDHSSGECGIPAYTFFSTPNKDKLDLWYSFDYGPIHFLHISTERPFEKETSQYRFIVDDIKKVNRKITPWLVVAGHRPMYTPSSYSNKGHQDGDIEIQRDLQEAFEDLFMSFHVDITWWGHVHQYSLSCPVYKNKCQGFDHYGTPRAPYHMVIGHGGQTLTDNAIKPLPDWFEKVVVANGYTRLEVNKTHFIQESIYANNGTLMDRLIIQKPVDWGEKFRPLKISR